MNTPPESARDAKLSDRAGPAFGLTDNLLCRAWT